MNQLKQTYFYENRLFTGFLRIIYTCSASCRFVQAYNRLFQRDIELFGCRCRHVRLYCRAVTFVPLGLQLASFSSGGKQTIGVGSESTPDFCQLYPSLLRTTLTTGEPSGSILPESESNQQQSESDRSRGCTPYSTSLIEIMALGSTDQVVFKQQTAMFIHKKTCR